MKRAEIEKGLGIYGQELAYFKQYYHLPERWFRRPDHVAIKCADADDYRETCTELAAQTIDGLWEASIDERMLASAQLSGKISVAGYSFGWVEVMQPKPGKEVPTGFVEHTEFVVRDLDEIERALTNRGLAGVEMRSNEGHAWVNVPINSDGLEIKFNDLSLATVSLKEQMQGVMQRIEQ